MKESTRWRVWAWPVLLLNPLMSAFGVVSYSSQSMNTLMVCFLMMQCTSAILKAVGK